MNPLARDRLRTMNDRTPLLLVPGQLSTRLMWSPQAAALGDIAAVTIADQNQGGTIASIAASVLDQAPPRFALAAHGMAGFVAFEMLRRAPDRVIGLALLDTLAPADNAAQTARRERYLEQVAAGNFVDIVEERIPVVVHPSRIADPAVAGVVRRMALDTGPVRFAAQTRAIMGRPDSRPSLRDIRCATVLIWGRQDGMATHEHQQQMLAGIGNARLAVLEDTGHFTTLERPGDVTRILRELIHEVRAAD